MHSADFVIGVTACEPQPPESAKDYVSRGVKRRNSTHGYGETSKLPWENQCRKSRGRSGTSWGERIVNARDRPPLRRLKKAQYRSDKRLFPITHISGGALVAGYFQMMHHSGGVRTKHISYMTNRQLGCRA